MELLDNLAWLQGVFEKARANAIGEQHDFVRQVEVDLDKVLQLVYGKVPSGLHEWQCVSPGEYDSTYRCGRCGLVHTESADNPESRLPESGCRR